ncbi:hypothetical protein BGZ76_001219, partial [Entomortierella beljakovae]
GRKQLNIIIDGKTLVFQPSAVGRYLTARVTCPCCSMSVSRNQAKRHYMIHLAEDVDKDTEDDVFSDTSYDEDENVDEEKESEEEEDDIPVQADEQSVDKGKMREDNGQPSDEQPSTRGNRQKRLLGDALENSVSKRLRGDTPIFVNQASDEEDIMKNLRGEVPVKIFQSTLETMTAGAYKVYQNGDNDDGYGMILPYDSYMLLKSVLPQEYQISKMEVPTEPKKLPVENLLDTHVDLSGDNLVALEAGGTTGLERIVGAIITTGPHRLEVLCAEVYNRDPEIDPHAESFDTSPSSIPTNGPGTQYNGRVKITKIPDSFKNMKLVLGVTDHNYLITSGLEKNNARVGPGRCAKFPVNHTTKIYVRKELKSATLGKIYGLAQIRSKFGDIATYSARRGAMQGFASITLLPITVFTLSQYNVQFSRVFRKLADRASESRNNKIVLQLSDVEVPEQSDNTKVAIITRKLIDLFPANKKLTITENNNAESILSELANQFSTVISNKNLTVAIKIISEMHGA